MARIEVHHDRVIVSLSLVEKMLSFHREPVVLRRAAIRSAVITDDPWIWIRGVSSPGTHVAGKIACGTWRGLGGDDFLLVRGTHKAVVIDMQDVTDPASPDSDDMHEAHFSRVILSTARASELIRALRLAETSEPSVHVTGKRAHS